MLLKIIRIALALALFVLLSFFNWLSFEVNQARTIFTDDVFFEVERGKGAQAISWSLKEGGIITKAWPFVLEYKLFFNRESLKAGEYAFHSPLSTKDILDSLIKGKVYLHPLTIPEGLTGKEIAGHLESLGILQEEEFIEAFKDTALIAPLDSAAWDLEGYLFPETYHLPKNPEVEDLVGRMVQQFKQVFDRSWHERAFEIGMTTRDVVVLASLIEKETSLPQEKGLVSAVFHNRLKLGMKLDCDPTIIYALKQEGTYEGRLRSKDLVHDSPYNTYLYSGLPPGPICNPGKDSLQAALYPAGDDYLYFVSRNDGSHQFSRTLRDHQNAVRKYQSGRSSGDFPLEK